MAEAGKWRGSVKSCSSEIVPPGPGHFGKPPRGNVPASCGTLRGPRASGRGPLFGPYTIGHYSPPAVLHAHEHHTGTPCELAEVSREVEEEERRLARERQAEQAWRNQPSQKVETFHLWALSHFEF